MSNKTHRKRHHREQKREQFSQPAKRNYNWLMLVVIVALVAVIGYLVTSRLNQDPTSTVANAKAIQLAPDESEARIPLSEGKAKFYEAALANGTSVRFFVVKTADGIYRTALDACQVCFDAHKGYYQDGKDMVCRKCGRHFPLTSIGYGTSGCHPMGLHGTVEGDNLVIRTSELQNSSQYF